MMQQMRGMLGLVKEPPKQEAPTPVLVKRLSLVLLLTLGTCVGSVVYFVLEETTVTENTNEVSDACPVEIRPQSMTILANSGSEYTAQIQEGFTVSSQDECETVLSINAEDRQNNQKTSGRSFCAQDTQNSSRISCFFSEQTFYTSSPQFVVSRSFRETSFDWRTVCPNFPAEDCLNPRVLNRSDDETQVCMQWSSGTERCLDRTPGIDFKSSEDCGNLFSRLLPHLCSYTQRNTVVTIISLTANNTSTVFAISLSLAFIIFKDAPAEDAKGENDDSKDTHTLHRKHRKASSGETHMTAAVSVHAGPDRGGAGPTIHNDELLKKSKKNKKHKSKQSTQTGNRVAPSSSDEHRAAHHKKRPPASEQMVKLEQMAAMAASDPSLSSAMRRAHEQEYSQTVYMGMDDNV